MWPRSILPLGDSALTVDFPDVDPPTAQRIVRAMDAALRNAPPVGQLALVPAIRSLTLHYATTRTSTAALTAHVDALLASLTLPEAAGRAPILIPVRYGGVDGPDLDDVAATHGTTPADIIAQHTAATYSVAMLGFLPGFPYLDGLVPALHTPRRATPRTLVPAGSVGIGGRSTGIYPCASPGGWHLIGRTSLSLFDPSAASPALLQPGDTVRFVAVPQDGAA